MNVYIIIGISAMITTIAGTGVGAYSDDNIQATSASLNGPWSMFITSDKNLYISDMLNHRIRAISPNGIITTIAGSNEGFGYNDDSIQATSATLNRPTSVFVTSSNIIYISDSLNHRIRRVSPTGIITTVAGTGVGGYNNDNIEATLAKINNPNSVFVGSDNFMYIADTDNNRIRKVSPTGIITTVAGTGEAGYNNDNIQATSANLNGPYRVLVTSDTTIYITDTINCRIRLVSPNGIISTIAGTGVCGYNGDNIQATSAQLNYPNSVFLSSDNTMYISELLNNRIRKVSPNGIISTIAGVSEGGGYNGDNIHATSAQLNYPTSVFVTPDHNVYICEYGNHRIRKITGH